MCFGFSCIIARLMHLKTNVDLYKLYLWLQIDHLCNGRFLCTLFDEHFILTIVCPDDVTVGSFHYQGLCLLATDRYFSSQGN